MTGTFATGEQPDLGFVPGVAGRRWQAGDRWGQWVLELHRPELNQMGRGRVRPARPRERGWIGPLSVFTDHAHRAVTASRAGAPVPFIGDAGDPSWRWYLAGPQ